MAHFEVGQQKVLLVGLVLASCLRAIHFPYTLLLQLLSLPQLFLTSLLLLRHQVWVPELMPMTWENVLVIIVYDIRMIVGWNSSYYPLKLPIGVLAADTKTTSFIRLLDEVEKVLNETLPKEAMSFFSKNGSFFFFPNLDNFCSLYHISVLKSYIIH